MWKHLTTIAVGGLANIGFTSSEDLVILSSQGRGIVSLVTGKKIFRDDKEWWPDFNQDQETITGFGLEHNQPIKISGLHAPDKLKKTTDDGWSIDRKNSSYKTFTIFKFYLRHTNSPDVIFLGEDGPCELKAYGFSDSYKALVIATSCEVIIWNRNDSSAQ